MTILEYIASSMPGGQPGKFISLGQWSEDLDVLLNHGWKGVHAGWGCDRVSRDLEFISCDLGADPHFVRLLAGYWTKACTTQEIFNQFPGPYDVVWFDAPEQNRMLWYSDTGQACSPRIYVLPEDGHNEDVVKLACTRGYNDCVMDGRLVLMHPNYMVKK